MGSWSGWTSKPGAPRWRPRLSRGLVATHGRENVPIRGVKQRRLWCIHAQLSRFRTYSLRGMNALGSLSRSSTIKVMQVVAAESVVTPRGSRRSCHRRRVVMQSPRSCRPAASLALRVALPHGALVTRPENPWHGHFPPGGAGDLSTHATTCVDDHVLKLSKLLDLWASAKTAPSAPSSIESRAVHLLRVEKAGGPSRDSIPSRTIVRLHLAFSCTQRLHREKRERARSAIGLS
jgi:hypothetical protein